MRVDLTVIVPTFNEGGNVPRLVERTATALRDLSAEILFVDDSTDDTPARIEEVAASASLPVRVIHRDVPTGGLGGAVLEGIRSARSDVCVVMDGDLQHPPEQLPSLWDEYSRGDCDVVVASRYVGGGSSEGLAGAVRTAVSRASTAITKAMFPLRLRNCTDPMTGYFLVNRSRVDLDALRPRGFKILLEILARHNLRIREIPFDFAERHTGDSKASLTQGFHFLTQLTALRFGKMSAFAVIGAIGALVNIGIVWMLTMIGVSYIWAAIVAAELTIIGNFLLIDFFVFRDLRDQASGRWARFAKSFAFNNAEAVIRIPIMALLVETWHISSVLATAITLAVAFIARFVFHSLVVYAPRKEARSPSRRLLERIDDEVMAPGEL